MTAQRMDVAAGGRAGAVRALAMACAAGLGLFLPGGAVEAQSTVNFTVSGNSTVRSWSCYVPGAAQVTTGSGAAAPGFSSGVQAATITVNVADFTCPEDEMREHLLEAMRAEEFPRITFRLDGYDPGGQGATARGSLTILDATRPVSFPIRLTPAGSGAQIAGELLIDMTQWGVEPPVVMLGLLRVRPQIRIEFEGAVTP